MARKAKQVEGHLNIGAISRGQQAYFFENKTFARKIVDLGLGIRWETNDYSYRIVYPSYPTHTQSSMPKTQNFPAIASIAYPKSEGLRTYLAMEWLAIDSATKELRNYSIRCRSEKSFEKLKSSKDKMLWFSKFSSPRQNNEDATMTCPTGFTKMS
ncbi:MAG: type IV pilin-like G/H family protein [Cyanobacteria bacterium SBLK]|nr:type IV pilin-like G/H family protein [Cyanobacteria bacterium SBLK]